jgi:hypothetical protein
MVFRRERSLSDSKQHLASAKAPEIETNHQAAKSGVEGVAFGRVSALFERVGPIFDKNN